MKDFEIIDQVIRSIDGLVRTDDSKVSELALLAKLPEWKQQAILMVYNGTRNTKANKFLNAQNFYKTTVGYNSRIQVVSADFILFAIEPAMQLDDVQNGFAFVGDELSGTAFTQLKHRSTYSTAHDAGLISKNEVYYEASGNLVKVWGNIQLKSLFLDYIPVDIMNVTAFNPVTGLTSVAFNPTTDEYPVSQDVLDMMFKIALMELAPQAAKPADILNNSVADFQHPSK